MMAEYSSNLSDSSDEECDGAQPAKRVRSNTLGASSQSDSSSYHPGASDGFSQSESEGEMGPPPGINMYKSYGSDYPKVHTMYSGKRHLETVEYASSEEQRQTVLAATSTHMGNATQGYQNVLGKPPEAVTDWTPHNSYTETEESPVNYIYTPSRGLESREFNRKSIRKTKEAETSDLGENSFDPLPRPSTVFSDKAQKMMETMGYTTGKGLGKQEQGRTAPIEASSQKGRTGLGFRNMLGKLPEDISWDPETDYANPNEVIHWMPDSTDDELSSDVLEDWVAEGPMKLTIDDETNFCEPDMLRHILASKNVFNTLKGEDLRRARTRSNPYETLGSVFFLNRAAVKMANMDAVFDFMFTDPQTSDGKKVIDNDSPLLYFADVCAGPGGFSEYILWRKKWRAKGFGFTLKKSNDFKLSDFYAGPPETFTPYYGAEDNGDITSPVNLESLQKYILRYTNDLGVHFLMADGGFSVENQENIQEILSKKLYLCQCIAGLTLIRTGGHFVVKLFDVFTQFSVGLVYLMYRSFKKVCIHKPRTSRPANSERYLICKWKRANSDVIGRHLFQVNARLYSEHEMGNMVDVVQLVPLKVIKQDQKFYNYICNSNNILGERQVQALLKIAAFSKDPTLVETRQAVIRKECLHLWKLPDMVRKAPQQWKVDEMVTEVMKLLKTRYSYASDLHKFKNNVLHKTPDAVGSLRALNAKVYSVHDWYFSFVDHNQGSNVGQGSFFLGLGGFNVKEFPAGTLNSLGGTMGDSMPKLPALTVVWGEIVSELKNENRAQQKSKVIHLLDALVIGGEPVAHLHIVDRHKQLQLLCSALENGHSVFRCKRLWGLNEAKRVIGTLEQRVMKNGAKASVSILPTLLSDSKLQPYHVVGGILLLSATQDPWHCFISKKHNKIYFFGPKQKSLFWEDKPREACEHALETHQKRLLWRWEPPSVVLKAPEPPPDYCYDADSPDALCLYSFYAFLHEKCKRN